MLEAPLASFYKALANLVYREGRYLVNHYTSNMAATVSVWKSFIKIFGQRRGVGSRSPYILLWRNPKLSELISLPDFVF